MTHEADLSWFFSGEAEAAVSGLRSPALEWSPGGDVDAHDLALGRIGHVRRHGRIARTLGLCSPRTRAVLRAHYTPRSWEAYPELPAKLGQLVGVVVHVARFPPPDAERAAVTRADLVLALVRASMADRSLVARLRAEANLALQAAHQEFCQWAPAKGARSELT